MAQKLFSCRVYVACCWMLLLVSVLLSASSYVVVVDGTTLSVGGIAISLKFVSPQIFMRALALISWCLIFVVGRLHGYCAKKDFLPIGFCIVSLGILTWRYPDVFAGTAYQDVSRWWFVLLLILGSISGMAISMFIDGWCSRRTENESKNTGLPRNSMMAIALLKMATLMSVIPIVGFVLFVLFYDGAWGLPSLWLVSFILLFVRGEDKNLSSLRKRYSDFVEYGAALNLLGPFVTRKNKEELLSRSTAQQVQVEAAKEIWELYKRYLEEGQIISHTTINQCGEQIVRIEWQTETGKVRECHLRAKQAYKYWEAYLWLCHNDNQFQNYSFSEETALLYAMQDHLLKEKGCSLVEWRMVRQDEADLEIIIKATPSINAQFPPGWTLLLLAVANGFLEGVRLLLKYGADTELANANGVTPVLYAVRYDNVHCLKLLIDAGAKVCVEDSRGYTALMIAAEHNCKSVVPVLLKEDVDVDKKTLSGKTALDIALSRHAGDIASMLRNSVKKKMEREAKPHRIDYSLDAKG